MFREQCCDRQNEFNANFNGYNDVNMDVDINVENAQMPAHGNGYANARRCYFSNN